jgi:hypothetical protein
MKNLADVKAFMGKGRSVAQWNDKREKAKLHFSHDLICELDTSGYIKEFLAR